MMPEMQEHQKKAFDFAADLIKQIITLSVAVITLGIGGMDKLNGYDNRGTLKLIFILYVVAIIFGIFALMNLTGALDIRTINTFNENADKRNSGISDPRKKIPHVVPETLSIYSRVVRWCSVIQVLSFGAAIIMTCSFAFSMLDSPSKANDGKMVVLQSLNARDSALMKQMKIDTIYYRIAK
ncbi:hypothetical protein [Taibaiella soli]|uniref:Uncharacterized protein n=1 Tax=Taibaiella soli TaxID=1649169 RepID=A0A2W2AEJ7_9BACT|nr:hypothetical protein [Taibaiella soli]PZF73711.1 hypothetical protein DN068_06865 [Taibaiella soli]